MRDEEIRRRVREARVGRLATVRPDGQPHVVPIVFALDGETLYTSVDEKPKRTPKLQRLKNIAANPAVELLVDHYDDDWDLLWWIRLGGTARLVGSGLEQERGAALLLEKYPQYEGWTHEAMIVIEVTAWSSWTYR